MRQRTMDAASAAALATATVAGTALVPLGGENARDLDVLGSALLVAAAFALAVRRTRPVLAASVATLGTIAFYALAYPGIFGPAPAVLGVYTVMSRGRRAVAVALGAGMTAAVALAEIAGAPGSLDGTLWVGGWTAGVLVVGELVRGRRDYLEAVEQRAAAAGRTREEAALRRASEERLWIAQELHDTLTHNISVINVQAGMALHLLDRDPERLRPALTAIREAGGDAMRELRAALGTLRRADADGDPPGLARVPALLDRAGSAGLCVTYETCGDVRPLPDDIDRAAYRILQEAMTNVLRHAGLVPVTVIAQYDARTVVIQVDNEVAGDAPSASGHRMGLIGMRERAVAAGGSLEAGPVPGGFRVRAELPL